MKVIWVVVLLVIATITSELVGQIDSPERFVQIRSIDFETRVIEVRNFGDEDEDLSGWRFCSHDENEDRQYSAAGGLNGMILLAGDSMFIHFNNDASEPGEINIGTIGGDFSQPLDTDGAYAIQFYHQTPFGNGNNIADHVQFSRFGADNNSADERSDEAQIGGVWTNQNDWVAVLPETQRVVLRKESSLNELHSPNDYENVFDFVSGDTNCDGAVNLLDVQPFVKLILSGDYSAKADLNLDGVVDLLDVSPFIDVIAGP